MTMSNAPGLKHLSMPAPTTTRTTATTGKGLASNAFHHRKIMLSSDRWSISSTCLHAQIPTEQKDSQVIIARVKAAHNHVDEIDHGKTKDLLRHTIYTCIYNSALPMY